VRLRSPHLALALGTLLVACASACSLLVDENGLVGSALDAGDAQTVDSADSSVVADASTAADTGARDASSDAPTTDATDAADDAGFVDAADAQVPCYAPARVRFAHVVNAADGGTTVAVMMAGASLQGDYIVVGVNYDPSSCIQIASVTDSAGNVYKSLIPAAANGGALALETWGAGNVAASVQNVVTVTFVGPCAQQNVKIAEYQGVDRSSPVAATTSMIGAPADPGDAAVATSGPAILFAHTADSSQTQGPGPGWTQIIIDEWATLAEETAAPEGGTIGVSEMPANDDAWVIQAVALRTCH
jgi:hypothetical protein